MRMKSRIVSVILAAVMVLGCTALFSSCGEKANFPVKIGDITIETEPKNVVVLDKNLADIISAIGYNTKLVGRSNEVNQNGITLLPSVGAQLDPSPASVDELGAEIVLTVGETDAKLVKEIEKNGAKLITLEKANTPKQLKSLYKKLGTILGGNIAGAEKASKAYSEIFSTMRDVKSAVQSYSVVKTACYLYIENGVLKTASPGTWSATMLDYTGAVNVFKNAESDVVDLAELRLSNPDYIFVDNDAVTECLKSSETLSTLKALDTNLYTITREEINMQGYTSLETLKKMTENMYPEDEDGTSD